ncbi:MAG: arsenate reductase ArsC [Halobacteriota archaeon]
MKSSDEKIKVLFICTHNSGRSQMAEEYLNRIAGTNYEAESAGYEPSKINPLVLEVMKEDGFDLGDKKTRDAWDLFREGKFFNYVITVCDRANEEECPLFPKPFNQLNWPFPDPESFAGSKEEKLNKTRSLRDSIKEKIQQFVEETAG